MPRIDPRLQSANKTVNDVVAQAGIRHSLYLERYKTQVVNDIIQTLQKDVFPDLLDQIEERLQNIKSRGYDTSPTTTTRLKNLLTASEKVVQGGLDNAYQGLVTELQNLSQQEANWQVTLLGKSVPVNLDFTTPSIEILHQLVTDNPFQGQVLSQYWDTVPAQLQKRIQSQVTIGLVEGENIPDIVSRLRGTQEANYQDSVLQGTYRDVEAVVRTAVNHVSTQAREETYDANSDVIDKVQLVATLDTRTTLICQKHDGEVYPINEGPRPPFHYNCRTTTVPVLKSWKDLGINLSEAPEGTRASMNGQVSETLNYGDWLSTQSSDVQDEALGPARAALFRSGSVSIDQFTNDRGQTLTLDQLADKN